MRNLDNYLQSEVAAALESVIPRAALGPFVSLNPSEKVTQLVELSNLVIGIRLFNKKNIIQLPRRYLLFFKWLFVPISTLLR